MPRRDVQFSPGEYYHLYNRGNNRQTIFFERKNYAFFLQRVREYLLPSGITIVAYCLMPNHYHLLAGINQADTSEVSDERKTSEVWTVTLFTFVEGDVRDRALVNRLFEAHRFDAVVHLAALAGVRASIEDPALYYDVNLNGTLALGIADCGFSSEFEPNPKSEIRNPKFPCPGCHSHNL